jgi:hypothetical protein
MDGRFNQTVKLFTDKDLGTRLLPDDTPTNGDGILTLNSGRWGKSRLHERWLYVRVLMNSLPISWATANLTSPFPHGTSYTA